MRHGSVVDGHLELPLAVALFGLATRDRHRARRMRRGRSKRGGDDCERGKKESEEEAPTTGRPSSFHGRHATTTFERATRASAWKPEKLVGRRLVTGLARSFLVVGAARGIEAVGNVVECARI